MKASAKKYDRQLRIWGAHGQTALETARVCVLGSACTATETLKNLVLGGIASFTVVDDAKVHASDLGNNFLLDSSALGKNRAAAVTDFLLELNENVAGSYVEESPAHLLASNPRFFADFQLILATQMTEGAQVDLDQICRELQKPLICIRSYGLVGYLRASLREHTVIESKPENTLEDLRLHKPWPKLKEYAASIDLQSIDDITHKHVPYGILLLKAVELWQNEHGSTLPATANDKAAFRAMLKSWQRLVDGVPVEAENFGEAISNAHKLFCPPSISPELNQILEDERTNLTPDSTEFWVLAAALKQFFTENNGQLPVEGSIPDMTSTTDMYLQLQRLYRDQADADITTVETHVQALLKSIGRNPASIPRTSVAAFVKNARNLRVVRYRTLKEELQLDTVRSDALRQALAAEDTQANASLYLLLRAVDRFHSTYNRFPGTFDGELEEDVALLKATVASVSADSGVGTAAVSDDLIEEIVRFGASELHVVAAIMGGIAAQETIKFITRQFVPVGGTLIYNAMASTTSVLRV
ncbi:g7312 [Coccomyxa elongata]